MGSDRISTPVLEAFLRQDKPAMPGVLPSGYEWPAAGILFCLIAFTGGPDWLFWVAIGASTALIYGLKAFRQAQLQRAPSRVRVAYEQWSKIERLQKHEHDRRLAKKVPEQVLVALEKAARAWHEARSEAARIAVSNPEVSEEWVQMVDMAMLTAAAAADPVVLRDDQYKKNLQAMESDTDLMNRVCKRILAEEQQMLVLNESMVSRHGDSASSLRERLEKARMERQRAEAELDMLI